VFISGIVGQFYRQFAVTIAVSTLISAFNSLTLSPALCALLLKPSTEAEAKQPLPRLAFPLLGAALTYWFLSAPAARWVVQLPGEWQWWLGPTLPWLVPVAAGLVGATAGWLLHHWLNPLLGWAFAVFNRGFDALTRGYLRAVGGVLRISVLVLLGYVGLLYLTYFGITTTPTGFIPQQDKGYLLVNLQLPDAASVARTDHEMRKLEDIALRTPGVKHTVTVSGQSVLLGANAPNFGTLYVMLDDFPNRLAEDRHADAVAARLQREFNEQVPGALVNVFGAPPVDGLGTAGGFKLVIEDPGDSGAKALEEAGYLVVSAGNGDPQLRDAFTGFRADAPWLFVDIDRVNAETLGVSVSEIINTLQVYFGSLYVNDFNKFGRTWQVNVQADARFRQKAAGLKSLKVKNRNGNMVPLSAFMRIDEKKTGPIMVQRYNLYPAVTVNASPAPGVSSGQGIAALERDAKEQIPPGMRAEWTELALLQLQTKDTAARAFILSVVLVFLVLAAQYESWALPLAVILVVPMCVLCALVGVRMAGLDINIFTQVGFVVLVGLACKNAILIVEFAKQRRDAGADRRTAALEACELRLRPIVMTSVAFIIGVVPLVLAEGAGAEMRHALGTAVFAGMIGVTAFGIFLTPVFFVTVQRLKDWWSNGKPPRPPEPPPEANGAAETSQVKVTRIATGAAGH
jgi:multidrug efflux pump